ncbi:hypothetical protein ADUPG1_007113, partial [Aduncisulcus paluster]
MRKKGDIKRSFSCIVYGTSDQKSDLFFFILSYLFFITSLLWIMRCVLSLFPPLVGVKDYTSVTTSMKLQNTRFENKISLFALMFHRVKEYFHRFVCIIVVIITRMKKAISSLSIPFSWSLKIYSPSKTYSFPYFSALAFLFLNLLFLTPVLTYESIFIIPEDEFSSSNGLTSLAYSPDNDYSPYLSDILNDMPANVGTMASFVYFEDSTFNQKTCSAVTSNANACDLTDFEMAVFEDDFDVTGNFSSITGIEYLLSTCYISVADSKITSISPVANLPQIIYLSFYGAANGSTTNILDIETLVTLNRLQFVSIYGNHHISDISVLYRNIGLYKIDATNNTNLSYFCHSESETALVAYYSAIFPRMVPISLSGEFTSSACPLSGGDYFPSNTINEIYDIVEESYKCSSVSKQEGSYSTNDLKCYTIHDYELRNYFPICLPNGSGDFQDGVVPISKLRSMNTCSTISLPAIVTAMSGLTTVNDITTLQGLEYTQGDSAGTDIGITTLNINGYDLSGVVNSNAENDKLVVQILAKAVYISSTITTGLTHLYASGCGISDLTDILDFTPIIERESIDLFSDGAEITQPFLLQHLDLSDNNITDVSLFITEDIFPQNTLTTLNLSNNNICDSTNVGDELSTYFTASGFSLDISGTQNCPCSTIPSFLNHEVCRYNPHIEPPSWVVRCWNGYYYDFNQNICVKACPIGESLSGSTCVTDSNVIAHNDIRCRVCEKENLATVLNIGSSYVSCECTDPDLYGDDCNYVNIPDNNLKAAICNLLNISITSDITKTQLESIESLGPVGDVDSFQGLQFATTMISFSVSSNLSNPIGDTEIAYLPTSLRSLTLNDVDLEPNTDFSKFIYIQSFDLSVNSTYYVSVSLDKDGYSPIFPRPGIILDNTAIDSYSLSQIVPSLDGIDSFSCINCRISDPTPLYMIGEGLPIDLSGNFICGTNLSTFLTGSFLPNVTLGTQTCNCNGDNGYSGFGSTTSDALQIDKVCAETQRFSNVWHVVCSSRSITTYSVNGISCDDFLETNQCSGGCEYGYECRYDSGEANCKQVIINSNLHDCVADMFGTDSNGMPDYTHRTATSPSLFSVASLKTLVSVDDGYGVYSPVLSCPSMGITDLTGIEHITEITSFDLSLNNLNTAVSPACLDSLMHLSHLLSLNLDSNSNITLLPDLTGMSSLTVLRLKNNDVNLPSETSQDPYLPSSLEELQLYGCDQFDQGAFDAHIGNGLLPNLKYLNLYSTAVSSLSTLTQTQRDSITTLVISIPDSQNVVPTMHNLETLTIADTTITSIPDLSNSADKLTFLNISNTSVSSLVEAGTLSNLETIKFLDCHVSDLSPLYHLSSLTSVYGTGNNICVGSAETIETIKLKFVSHASLTLDLWTTLSTDQACECSSADLGTTPIADNLICSETKPWSNTWYVVCASDSYTSYTSADAFDCYSPDNNNGTFGCSGGCEYGQECRYDSTSTSTSCQQVIVDENLHDCVADMFGTDSNGMPDYTHRTATSPSLFSVASLKTIISAVSGTTFSPMLLYNNSYNPILDLAGVEHLVGIKCIQLSGVLSSTITDAQYFSTLTNLVSLNL